MATESFTVMPFASDGDPLGSRWWTESELSAKWRTICLDFLSTHGSTFHAHWTGNLGHISTRVTSAQGAGIATFSAHDKLACSMLLLTGKSEMVETHLSDMFIESLRGIELVRMTKRDSHPFETIRTCSERPLMVVVVWPTDQISQRNRDLVKELSLHLASEFFSR